jgi:hypothetical protein
MRPILALSIPVSLMIALTACLFEDRPIRGVIEGVGQRSGTPGVIGGMSVSASGARFNFEITATMPMTIRLRTGTVRPGTLDEFAIGDSVLVWTASHGVTLDSDPPVYPVTRLEVRK